MKDDSFDCTLIAHLRIFLLFYRLLYCLILPENRLFFGIWKVVEIEYAEYHPMILSGGQRQRLAICQAVMGEKKLLIFDEPTSGLDFRHMCQVEKLMKQLSEEKYIIIVVTHDYEFLNRACKRYIRINS